MLAHFTAHLLRPYLKKTQRLKTEDLMRWRPKRDSLASPGYPRSGAPAEIVDLEERRRYLEEHRRKYGPPVPKRR